MFVTYVLYSEKFNQLYIGYTSDLINRFHSHNSLAAKGHTIKYRPWIVAYVEFHETKNQSLLREKQLKSSRGRNFCRNRLNSGSYPSGDGRPFESGPSYQSKGI